MHTIETSIARLKDELHSAQAKSKSHQQDMDSFTTQIHSLESRCKKLEDVLENKRATIHELERSNKNLQATVQDCRDLLETKSAEIALLQSEVENHRRARSVSPRGDRFVLEDITGKINELEADNTKLKQKLLAVEGELKVAKEKLSSRANVTGHDQSKALEKQTAQHDDVLDALRQELELKKGEALLATMQLNDVRSNLERLEVENKKLKVVNDHLESRSKEALKKLHGELERINSQYQAHEKVANDLHDSNHRLRAELESMSRANQQLQSSIQSVQSDKDRLAKELNTLQARNANLEGSIAQLNETIADLQLRSDKKVSNVMADTANSLKAEVASLEQSLRQLRAEQKTSTQTQKKLAVELDLRRQEIDKLKKENESLLRRREELEKRLTQESTSALFIKEQLTAAAGALKYEDETDTASVGTPDPRPLSKTALGSQAVSSSIANMTVPEIVAHYETKLQRIYHVLEQGEASMQEVVEMMRKRDEKRRQKKQHHHQKERRERIIMFDE